MFSQEVVKRSDLFLTTKFDMLTVNTEIEKMRLLLWKNTAGMMFSSYRKRQAEQGCVLLVVRFKSA